MLSSENVDKIAGALAAFQSEATNPKTSKTVKVTPFRGPEYSYNYTPLNEIIDAIKPLLAKNGLSYMQSTGSDVQDVTKISNKNKDQDVIITITGTASYVVTRLFHTSGQWLESDALQVVTGAGAQEIGSAITYARRYQLAAMLGLATDDDDDCNGSDGQPTQVTPKGKPPVQSKPSTPPTARSFDEVDLSKVPDNELAEALNYVAFKSGKNAGKTMGELPEKDLEWLIGAEKVGDRTKAKAKMVLAWKRSDKGEQDEALQEEPPW